MASAASRHLAGQLHATQRPQVPTYRFSREEYHRLGEMGFFQNVHTELIDGEILVAAGDQRVNVADLLP